MGRRASMFRCQDCDEEFWEWFEWMGRQELMEFARDLRCPECDSPSWELTDASSFAGGQVRGEAAIPHWLGANPSIVEVKAMLGVNAIEKRLSDIEEGFFDERDPEGKSEQ